MLIVLYNFSKKNNSTLEPNPNNSTSTTLSNVEIKEGCSFLYPTLIISPNPIPNQVFSPTQYNYVSIPYWMRYYFIKDWRWMNGVWEVDLTVDVLASFKSAIGDTDAYIIRSSRVYDSSIMDTKYISKTNPQIVEVPVSCAWYGVAPSGGCYVLGVLNYQKSSRVGAVSYYALNNTQMGNMMYYLMTDQLFWSQDIDEIGEGLYKAISNPLQYIVSCMWFPFDSSTFGNSSTTIKVGYYDTNVNGVPVTSLAHKTYVTATIPDHPQISRGQYLNRTPYTNLTIYIPPFGMIPIDTAYLNIGNYLYSACVIDHITGLATLRLAISPSSTSLNEYNIFTEQTSMIGVPIQISQLQQDYVGSWKDSGGSLTGGLWDAVAGLSAGVLDFVSSFGSKSKVASVGANGSFIECILQPVIVAEHYFITDENRSEFGRPLCSTRRISTIPGYIQCGDADHEFPCTDEEKQQINKYLQNGFFYE